MQDELFKDLLKSGIEYGQSEFANTIRMLVYRANSSLFELLDFSDDNCFLEPLLFAFFTTENAPVPLEQILYGYLEDNYKPDILRVVSDNNGIVHLANIGYLQTSLINQELLLYRDKQTGSYHCLYDDEIISVDFKNLLNVTGSSLEICRYNHPLLTRFFNDDQGHVVAVEVEKITCQQIEHLNIAFNIIRNYCPDYYDAIIKVTRKIIIYSSDYQNSFATLSAHGIGFFNTYPSHDEVFFLDDIAHQCGHVIFNTITREKDKFLMIDPATPLRKLTGDNQETRTIYSALHGLFTFTVINQILNTCYENNLFIGKQKHELLGRLSFNMKKFKVDLVNLNRKEIFTEIGWLCFKCFTQVYQEIYDKRRFIIDPLDQSNQPYVFSYERFAVLNPLTAMDSLMNRRIKN